MSEKKDLKLNLLHTKIPMKAALNQREPEFLQIWKDRKVYQKIRQHQRKKKNFTCTMDLSMQMVKFTWVML